VARLIIHAGFHKTGTTSVQVAFAEAASALKKVGITYPSGFGKHAQHSLAKIRAANPESRRFRSIKKLTQKHDTVLLSSEFFSEFNADSVRALKKAIGPKVKAEVVFSYRPLELIVTSQYQQLVRTGYQENLTTFARSILDRDNSHHEAKLFWRRHETPRILSDWAAVVGAENVHLVIVNQGDPELIGRWFETYLGLAPEVLSRSSQTRMNRSLDIEEIELIRAIRSMLSPDRVSKEWKPIFMDKFISTIASRPSTNPNSPKLTLEQDLLGQFQRIGSQAQDQIRELGINIHGPMLGPKNNLEETSGLAPTSIHIETVARAIAAVRPDHHLRQASVRDMASEIWYRVLRRLRGVFPKN
jgi:hypothetical protein